MARCPACVHPLALLLLVGISSPAVQAASVFPLADVRPGMEGFGLTVFAGTRIDTFGVRVLGVQQNQRVAGGTILVQLSGPGLELAAIPQGMSGSPVFLEGRLAGAVAFTWEGALLPICGLTPAEEIMSLPAPAGDQRRAAGVPSWSLGGRALVGQGGRELAAALFGPGSAAAPPTAPADPLQSALAEGSPWPSAAALAEAFWRRVTGVWSAAGGGPLAPVPAGLICRPLGAPGGGAGADSGAPAAALAPGAACAVPLVLGDAELGAIGTVTWVEGDTVYMFGHPLLQAGVLELPLAAAEVHGWLPSRQMSFKMGSVRQVVGATSRDLRAGVTGRLGAAADLVPVAVTVRRDAEVERYDFRVAADPRLAPALVFWCVYGALVARGDDLSQQTLAYRLVTRWHAAVEGGEETVELAGVLAGPGAAAQLGPEWLAPAQLLFENRHRPLALVDVSAEIDLSPQMRAAQIVGAEAPLVARAGGTLPVTVTLQTHRGAVERVQRALLLPAHLPPGGYRLLVASARDLFALEAERAAERFADQSLPATLEVVRQPRSAGDLVCALLAPAPGAVVDGRELPSLPGRAAAVLRGDGPGRVAPTRAGIVLRDSAPLGSALKGHAILSLTLVPPRATSREVSRP